MSAPARQLSEEEVRQEIRAKLNEHSQAEQRLIQLRLDRILRRKRALASYPSPGHLAKLLAPDTVQTRMMTALDQVAIAADSGFQRRWIISTPPQEGKALRRGTPVLSLRYAGSMSLQQGTVIRSGVAFRKIEDIQVGDYVFQPDGKPVRVEWVSGAQLNRSLYRVTTSDGRVLEVDADHLWTVQDRRKAKQRGSGKDRVRWMEWETITTAEILRRGLLREKPRQRPSGSWTKANAIRLPRQEAVQTPDVDLPVEPYLLGLWLADGSHTSAQIVEGVRDADELAANIEDAGGAVVTGKHEVATGHGRAVIISFVIGKKFSRDGFLARARNLGILGNKHIPETYLTAGTQQRLALLQGLLDGDGAISTNGNTFRVEYTTVIPQLAEQVLFLVRSLGWRATTKDSKATLDGVEKKRRYRVCFTPVRGEYSPFRLARKAARVQEDKSRGDERHVVTIDSIEELPNGTAHCLKIESPEGLFLAGRDLVATHNTQRMGTAAPLWFLMRNPTRRIVVASYEQSLASRSTLAVRQAIETYGGGYKGDRASAGQDDQLGLILDPDQAKQANWNLIDGPKRKNGGMVAVGVGGSLTGRSADVLIIDDAIKNSKQADNPTQRQMIWEWYQAVATTRLSPGAIVVVIGTRWHENDLIGRLLAQDEDSRRPLFRHLNISAIAKGDDPLGRKPGDYLVSTRGRTPEDWDEIRRQVGERFWAALYMGEPSPPAGGVFQLGWLNRTRVPVAPELAVTEVFVDPADNEGDGDEAGVITMARGVDQELYVLADDSGQMTSGRWFRVAFLAALRADASAIRYEKSLSGLRRIARKAWKDLLREAKKLHELDPFKYLDGRRPHIPDEAIVYQAARDLARDDAEPEEIVALERDLNELWPLVPKVLELPMTGIPVSSFFAKGTKTYRAKMVAPVVEWGKVHLVGRKHSYVELVHQLVSWQESQDSPDRMDTFVHGVARLGQSSETVMEPPKGNLPPRAPTATQQLLRQGVSRGSGLGTGRYG